MRLRTLVACLATALSVGLALAVTAAADDGGRPFTTTLTGAAEVPGPGDPDGSGTASLTLNIGQSEVCFQLSVSNVALPATGAHIHAGAATSAGPVVVALTPPGITGTSSGCVSADAELIKNIIRNPENYYVNVHTTEYPPGAVRGQLGK